jgi:Type I restriction enzyme R protein N terminus (HSDR_N)
VPKFNDMNETDVREIIVRPLLNRLGYEHGNENSIRTEQTFRYAKAFLGRKNIAKDPPLVGRADYILEVAAVGRWVVEVKGAAEELSRDVVEQAHTYAAHPEVSALFFMVTNGRSFRLYRTSSLDAPIMSWDFEEAEEVFLALANLVGPDAIRRKMKLLKPDAGKPLGRGLGSEVQIIGGWIQYEDHVSNHPLLNFAMNDVNGLRLPITGGTVGRADDARLHAKLNTAKAMPMVGELSELLEVTDGYDFYATDELISTDQERPTIFKNLIHSDVPVGTQMKVPGLGTIAAPFGFRFAATTEAVGFVEGDVFKGTMALNYQFAFMGMPPMVKASMEAQFGPFPPHPQASGGGLFEVQLLLR